nr:MAG TPA: hypothetical protein [Caudoviricetes sp.]
MIVLTIGENIRKFRVQCNLTQKELGKLIGTTQQSDRFDYWRKYKKI